MKFVKLVKSSHFDFIGKDHYSVSVHIEGKSLFAPFVDEVFESGGKQMTNSKEFYNKDEALSFANKCKEKFGKKYKDKLSIFVEHFDEKGHLVREDFIKM